MAFRLALNTSTLSFPSPPKMIVQSLLADLAAHTLLAVLPPENDDFAIEDVPRLRGWSARTISLFKTPFISSLATSSSRSDSFRINTCRNTRGYPSLPPAKLSSNLFKELLHVRSHQNC